SWVLVLTGTLLGGTAVPPLRAAEPDPKLAQQGYDFLNKYCYACHGLEVKKAPLKVLDRNVLLGQNESKKKPRTYVVPGKPEESYLWERVEADSMPPDNVDNRPKEEE